MSSMAKTKGKNYENKIAKMLNEHLLKVDKYNEIATYLGNDNLLPKRDFSSGNFVNSDGDIDLGIGKKFFPFSIECKHHKDMNFNIESIFKDKVKKLVGIWNEQCIPNAVKANLDPLLVFRANRTKDYVMFDIGMIDVFILDKINKYIKMDNFIICLFDDFVENFLKQEVEDEII